MIRVSRVVSVNTGGVRHASKKEVREIVMSNPHRRGLEQ